MRHVIEIMRWSSPSNIGTCWATWSVFKEKQNWINEHEVNGLISTLEKDKEFKYQPRDKMWLEILKKCPNATKEHIARIDKLINTAQK